MTTPEILCYSSDGSQLFWLNEGELYDVWLVVFMLLFTGRSVSPGLLKRNVGVQVISQDMFKSPQPLSSVSGEGKS